MSIFDKLFGRGGKEKLLSDSDLINNESSNALSLFGQEVSTGKNTTQLLESNTGWVFSSINAISNEVAGIKIKLFKVKNNGDVEEIRNHRILNLLNKINSFTTRFDFLYLTQTYLELTGEAPWYISYKNGVPNGLLLLRPDRIEVLPPANSKEYVGGYKYKVYENGGRYKEIRLEPYEVIFLKYPDTIKTFRGKGTLQSALLTVDIDDSAEAYNFMFFKNSAVPNAVLSTDKKIAKDVKSKLRKLLKMDYQGVTNSSKTMILEGGLKFDRMSISQKDMDFIESQKFTRDKILSIFRVPKSVLGLVEDVNRANAEASNYVFSKYTIKPKMQKIIEQLNEFLVPLFDNTGTLFLDYEDPTPENVESKRLLAESGVSKGYITPNEAREMFGLEALDGGDELAKPVANNKPVSKKKEKKLNFDFNNLDNARIKASGHIKKKKIKKSIEVRLKKNLIPIVKSLIKDEKKKKRRVFSEDPVEAKKEKYAYQDKQLAVVDDNEKLFLDKLAQLFNAQKKEVLNKLQNAKSVTKDINPLLFLLAEKKNIKLTVEKLSKPVVSTIVEQSKVAVTLLGTGNPFTSHNDIVKDYLKNNMESLAKGITKETNRRIGKALSDGVAKGESIPKLSKRVRGLFDDMKESRSITIARTEVIKASSYSAEQTYIESEVVDGKEWITTFDAKTDDECIEVDGEVVPLKKTFSNGLDGPPLHPNCRCTLAPDLKPL